MQPRARGSTSPRLTPLVCTCCAQSDANVADFMFDADEAPPPRAHTGPPRGMVEVPPSRYEPALDAAGSPAPGTDAFQTAVGQVDAPRTPQGKQPVNESRSDDSWMYLRQAGSANARARRGREYEILRTGLQGHVPWPPVHTPAPKPESEPEPAPAPVPEPEPAPAPAGSGPARVQAAAAAAAAVALAAGAPPDAVKANVEAAAAVAAAMPVQEPPPVRRSGRIRERAARRG